MVSVMSDSLFDDFSHVDKIGWELWREGIRTVMVFRAGRLDYHRLIDMFLVSSSS